MSFKLKYRKIDLFHVILQAQLLTTNPLVSGKILRGELLLQSWKILLNLCFQC